VEGKGRGDERNERRGDGRGDGRKVGKVRGGERGSSSFAIGRKKTAPMAGRPKKRGHKLTIIILSNLYRFTIFFTDRFPGKFAVNCY